MEIVAIEKKTFQLIKNKLKEFSIQVREICNKDKREAEWFGVPNFSGTNS